jgi:hypothetical protein
LSRCAKCVCLESLGEMLVNADAVKGGPVQDDRMDLSRLTDEQLRILEELMTIAWMVPAGHWNRSSQRQPVTIALGPHPPE